MMLWCWWFILMKTCHPIKVSEWRNLPRMFFTQYMTGSARLKPCWVWQPRCVLIYFTVDSMSNHLCMLGTVNVRQTGHYIFNNKFSIVFLLLIWKPNSSRYWTAESLLHWLDLYKTELTQQITWGHECFVWPLFCGDFSTTAESQCVWSNWSSMSPMVIIFLFSFFLMLPLLTPSSPPLLFLPSFGPIKRWASLVSS